MRLFLLCSAAAAAAATLPSADFKQLHQEHLQQHLVGKVGNDGGRRRLAISDNSILTISDPAGGINPISLSHSDALFGLPLHGATLTAPLSSYLVLSGTSAAKGCLASDYASPILKGSVIVLERGNCSFAQKVLAAQNFGDARGIIVLDTFYLCGIDNEICDSSSCSGCEYGFEPASPLCLCTLSMMSGDQNVASQITIPAMMVTRQDGARLKTLAEIGKPLLASMSWDLPERNGAAEMTLWGQSQDSYTAAFREGFAPYLPYLLGAGLGSGLEKTPSAIVPRLAFTPKQWIFDGRSLGCGVYFDCGSSCVNAGRYCSYDAGDENLAITGAQVVTEALRDICVWQYLSSRATGNTPGISPSATPSASVLPSSAASKAPPAPAPSHLPLALASATLSFWSYIELVTNNCFSQVLYGTQECAEAQMGLINVAARGEYPSFSPVPSPAAGSGGGSLPLPTVRPAPGEWTLRPEFLASGIPLMSIDESVIEACFLVSNQSYNATGDAHTWNSLLQPELEAQAELSLYQIPSVVINDVLLRGGVSPKAALIGLCNSYGSVNPLPLVCSCIDFPPETLQSCVSAAAGNSDNGNTGGNGFPSNHPSGLSKGVAAVIAVVVCLAVVTVAAVFFLQRRSTKRVEDALDQHYRSLSNGIGPDEDRMNLIESASSSSSSSNGGRNGSHPVGRSKPRASSIAREGAQASMLARLQQLARVGPQARVPIDMPVATSSSPYLDQSPPSFANGLDGSRHAEMRTFNASASITTSSGHGSGTGGGGHL